MTDRPFPGRVEAELAAKANKANSLALPRVTRKASEFVASLRKIRDSIDFEKSDTSIPRPHGYGLVKLQPELVFKETDSSGRIHLVFVIAADEIDGVFAYVIDDTPIFPQPQLDSGGNVTLTNDRYRNKLLIRLKRGAPGQTADGDLVFQAPSVKGTFVGTGIAWIWVRMVPTQGLLSESTKIEVIARLRKPVDPRGGAPKWTINPYVQLYDLLTKSRNIGGAGIDPSLIDTAAFQEAAAWAEETVATPSFTKTTVATQSAVNVFQFQEGVLPFQYGDVVRCSTTGGQTLPAAISPGVDYHVIPFTHIPGDITVPSLKLATSFANAMAGNPILHGAVPSDFQMTKVGEVRYHSSFSYRAGEEIVDELLQSCGAHLVFENGLLSLVRSTFPDPVEIEAVSLDEVLSAIGLSNKVPIGDRVTELTGIYTSLLNRFKQPDYSKVDGGGIYEAADGKRSARRFDLPFVGSENAAQRLATVELRKGRLERTVSFKGDIGLYRLKPGAVFWLDAPDLGLDASTTFRVEDQVIAVEIENDRPFISCDITGRQYEAEAVDVSASAQALAQAAAITAFPSVRIVLPPGAITVEESLFQTTDGAGVRNRVTLSWTGSADVFLAGYRVSYKLSSAPDYIILPDTEDLTIQIDDLAPGSYDFRVRAVNTLGLRSEPSERLAVAVQGLTAPPSDPTSFFGQVVGSASVLLQWDRHPDLDVRVGGKIQIYHHNDIDGGNAGNAVFLGEIDGGIALHQAAFKRGTYYLRAVDQSGVPSDFAEWSTEGVRPVPFAQTITSGAFDANDSTEDQFTIQEDPTWPSSNPSNTLVHNDPEDRLELPPEDNWDDIPDVDALADVDAIGADGTVQLSGVYFFSTGVSLNAVTRMLVETELETEIVDIADNFDVVADVDALADVDAIGAGTAVPGVADAWIEVRATRDDPTGSPTWGPWTRIDTRVLNHRGLEFRIQARSTSPNVNIYITGARILIREMPVDA